MPRKLVRSRQIQNLFLKVELKGCADGMWTVGVACLSGLLFLTYKKLRDLSIFSQLTMGTLWNEVRKPFLLSLRQSHLLPGRRVDDNNRRKEGLDRDKGRVRSVWAVTAHFQQTHQ